MESYSGTSIYLGFGSQGKVRTTHGFKAATMITQDLGGQLKRSITPEMVDIWGGEPALPPGRKGRSHWQYGLISYLKNCCSSLSPGQV